LLPRNQLPQVHPLSPLLPRNQLPQVQPLSRLLPLWLLQRMGAPLLTCVLCMLLKRHTLVHVVRRRLRTLVHVVGRHTLMHVVGRHTLMHVVGGWRLSRAPA
jgi:hypothetical protein